jgi:phosphatidate cytidylyltransferase
MPNVNAASAWLLPVDKMFRQRLLVVVVLLPLGIFSIINGGWMYAALTGVILGLAASEYAQLFKIGGYNPSRILVVCGVLAIFLARFIYGFSWDAPVLVLIALICMATYLAAYEKGSQQTAFDFAITLSGIFYLGILGSYFILLRDLPNGMWWTLVLLPSIWWGDTGAYFIGSWIGQHKFSPRLSPKKTWEGYLGGIVFAVLGTPLLVLLYYHLGLSPKSGITLGKAAILGAVMGIFATLGDLGISMLKRQFGVKDTGSILPGHGGMLDRIDSWIWGLPIGYYLIIWFFQTI